MKAILLSLALSFALLHPVLAATPSERRPSQATLLATFKLPVMVDGKPGGTVTAPKGTLVKVEHVRKTEIMISLGSASAWVKRSDTDFDGRLVAFKAARQKLTSAYASQDAAFKKQAAADAADFEKQHAAFDNPLNKGAYDQQRSVVDYYDWQGRRYHIGVFGQRIYD